MKQLVQAFYGKDPIRGDAALRQLAIMDKMAAIEAVVPMEAAAIALTAQSLPRLQQLAERLGPDIAPYLAEVIRQGSWPSKGAAAACFGGLDRADGGVAAPLIEILKAAPDVDACRYAIEALGYLGADGWSIHIADFMRSGDWNTASGTRGPDRYSVEKYAFYAIQAFARFVARADNPYSRSSDLRRLTEAMTTRKTMFPNLSPTPDQVVESIAEEFQPAAVDILIAEWGESGDEPLQELCCHILGVMAARRSARFLLDVAISPSRAPRVRIAASIALGDIRHPETGESLAAVLREPGIDTAHLNWAFSTLRALPVDWSEALAFEDRILGSANEISNQLLYSLAIAGVANERHKSLMIGRLDSQDPSQRWTAALALARMLGPDARALLDQRDEEAGDALERCAMLAAQIYAGDLAKAGPLSDALQDLNILHRLRVIWRAEILGALQVGGMDLRALTLWWTAAKLNERHQRYFLELTQRNPFFSTGDAKMISIADVSLLADVASKAISIIDTVYNQFVAYKEKRHPSPDGAAHSSAIVNAAASSEIVAKENGKVMQTVTYDELSKRLTPQDMTYITVKEGALKAQFDIWSAVYPQLPLQIDPVTKKQLELRLDQISKDMGKELSDILGFLQDRLGLRLDDHYQAIRQIARQ